MAITPKQLHDVWEVLELANQSTMETVRQLEDASYLVRPAGDGLQAKVKRLADQLKATDTELRALRQVLYGITPEDK